MQTRYDPDVDALYSRLAEAKVEDSEEVGPGIVLDFGGQVRVVGIEILDVSENIPAGADLVRLTAA